MGNSVSIMRNPLALTLLLSTIPLSQSYFLYRRKSSSSSSSSSPSEAAKDVLNSSLYGTWATSSSSSTTTSPTDDNGQSQSLINNENNNQQSPFEKYVHQLFHKHKNKNTNDIIQIPKMLSTTIPSILSNIFYYKPPVGITSIYIFFKLYTNIRKSSKSSTKYNKNINNIVSKLLLPPMFLNEEEEQRQLMMEMQMQQPTQSFSTSTSTKMMRKKRIGKNLELDYSDGKLLIGLGGVEAVRTELCLAAIEDYIISNSIDSSDSSDSSSTTTTNDTDANTNTNTNTNANNNEIDYNDLNDPRTLSYYAQAAKDALQINAAPMSSREDFIEKMIGPLTQLEPLYDVHSNFYSSTRTGSRLGSRLRSNSGSSSGNSSTTSSSRQLPILLSSRRDIPAYGIGSGTGLGTSTFTGRPSSVAEPNDNDNKGIGIDIIWMSSKVAEVRTIDTLLRALRDRLVLSAERLSRKEKYRVWRLQWYENGLGRFFLFDNVKLKTWMRKTMKNKTVEDDRRNLQLTRAALKREMERLGQVQQLLLNRPCELSETRLLTSVQATVDDDDNDNNVQTTSSRILSSMGVGHSKAFNSGHIDSAGARLALLRSECDPLLGGTNNGANISNSKVQSGVNPNPIQQWTDEAHQWTMTSRAVICDLVTETISDVFHPSSRLTRDRKSNIETDLSVLTQWSTRQKSDVEGWDTVLTLIDNLSKARLMREHKYLPTAIDLKYWFKQLDILAIPSSLATLGAALVVHNTVKPYWSDIVTGAKIVGETTWGVIEFRFVNPLKDIVLDLLNRRPKLLDPFSLSNEESSLDNMLRDLGIGDGTKEGRREALASASRMYEEELAQGAIKKLFRGEMVRLLLIQVQQLKTGLLQAMGTLDDLMDSNRLNVQLLATIPAVLLVTFGTRFFFRAMFSLRSKDFVGLPSAHAEMKDILMKMERCLLLASHGEDQTRENLLTGSSPNGSGDYTNHHERRATFLRPNELGEFVLYMHSYLVILDYCSPPFPSKTCDNIHAGMQELLMQGQLSTKRQIALLQLISATHEDLLKSI